MNIMNGCSKERKSRSVDRGLGTADGESRIRRGIMPPPICQNVEYWRLRLMWSH
jgi:hypothetical protein